ncbi:hypothetical protein VXE65_22745 [Mycolicibacterium conceptionense]|uniref:hypothetical protein n=1 Tax=Mycolicibacterium conceptionense TaxID=451644 RepID=UPI003204AD7B
MTIGAFAPSGWTVMHHRCNDYDLPEQFRALGFHSNNIGAEVWLNLATGAMVAAIPTGLWKERARFAFYYTAPGATHAIPLAAWTKEQDEWDGSSVIQCDELHQSAVQYFNKLVA